MKRWETFADGYLRQCETRGLSPATIYTRQQELGRLGFWLRKRKPRPNLESVDGELLIAYIQSRCAFASKATVAGVLSNVRNFGEYLVEQGVWVRNPLRWIQGPKLDPRRLLPRRVPKADLLAVFAEAAKARELYHRHLCLALLSVLYATGLRRGELERLKIDDYNYSAGTLRIDGRKSNSERTVSLAPSAVRCVEAYLPLRFNVLCKTNQTAEKALFVGKSGHVIKGERASLTVSRLARRAGVSHVTLHQFRHSCASDLLEDGIGLAEVQRILGHAALVTTFRYTQIADPHRKNSMARHPINDILSEGVLHG